MCVLREREIFSSRAHARSHMHFKNNGEREQLSIWIPQFDVSRRLAWLTIQFLVWIIKPIDSWVSFRSFQDLKVMLRKIGFFSQNFLSRNLLLTKFSTSCEIFFSQSLSQKFLLSCKVVSLLYVRRVVGGGGTGSAVLDVFVVTHVNLGRCVRHKGPFYFFGGFFSSKN